jgi:hypothetical protein
MFFLGIKCKAFLNLDLHFFNFSTDKSRAMWLGKRKSEERQSSALSRVTVNSTANGK